MNYPKQKYIQKYIQCGDEQAELIAKRFKDKPFSELKAFLSKLKRQNVKDGLSIYQMKSTF